MSRIGPTAAARTRCGCSPTVGLPQLPTKATGHTTVAKLAQRLKTNQAMCSACTRAANCPRDRKRVTWHALKGTCPRGWHADNRGRVTWRGLMWSGVPFPIRLYLFLRKPDADPETWVASFAGCGCVRKWKAAWLRLARMWRRM